MRYSLFLDDERHPPANGRWEVARSVAQAIRIVKEKGYPQFVSFDHDLGYDLDKNQPWPTGMDFARFLVDLDIETNRMPEGFQYYVHSQNPVGVENIRGLLDCYLRVRL
jgi:hypothetical protein